MDKQTILREFEDDRLTFQEVCLTICASCEAVLRDNAIPAIVTSRVKTTSSLNEKIERKASEGVVISALSDVHDLVGIRIALYFPSQISDALNAIKAKFTSSVLDEKDLPDPKEPNRWHPLPGYRAKHLIIISDPSICMAKKSIICEIQITSVMMHSWSEVEHDLVYKKITGEPSEDEIELLKQINANILSSEIALDQIRKKILARNKEEILSPFQLNGFISAVIQEKNKKNLILDFADTEAMYLFLAENGFLDPTKLKKIVERIQLDTTGYSFSFRIHQILAKEIEADNSAIMITFDEARVKTEKPSIADIPFNTVITGMAGGHFYWFSEDGRRYVFPNQATYLTWFPNGPSQHITRRVRDSILAEIPIGGNVTIKPGTRIIKIKDGKEVFSIPSTNRFKSLGVPAGSKKMVLVDGKEVTFLTSGGERLYLVSSGGVIRQAIPSVIEKIYGKEWESLMEEVPEGYFVNYTIGDEISDEVDFDLKKELSIKKIC